MLTRFEVTGFKNLRDVSVDFGSLTCIAGANGVGKSNLFDAIQFFADLSRMSFTEALAGVRSHDPSGSLDIASILSPEVWRRHGTLSLAAEMIVPSEVRDSFDQQVLVDHTYLRYELDLTLRVDEQTGIARLMLTREHLVSLERSHVTARYGDAGRCFESWVKGRRGYQHIKSGADGVVTVRSGGKGRPSQVNIERAQRSVLSQMASAQYPALLAVREEIASWRFLALEPTAMREPDSLMESRPVSESGAHVPAALFHEELAGEARVCDQVRADLSELVDVRSVRIVRDDARQTLELRAKIGEAPELPARSLSDGTLRFLTLAAIDRCEPLSRLVAMEEPENGIHPAKLGAMLELLRRLASPSRGVLRQVVINTHSPHLVEAMTQEAPEDLLIAMPWMAHDQDGGLISSTRFHPLTGTWRATLKEDEESQPLAMTPFRLRHFLENTLLERAVA